MSSPTQAQLVDVAILDGYRVLQDEGEPDIITEFIDTFLEDLPPRLAAIRSAVEGRNAREIKSAAHALKGSSASIGAAQLAALCSTLELMGKTGDLASGTTLLAEIETATEAARVALAGYRDPAVALPLGARA